MFVLEVAVKDQTKESWFQLCALATHEDDPTKLLALVTEVNRLLMEKEQLLTASQIAEMRRTWRDIAREVDGEQHVRILELAPMVQ